MYVYVQQLETSYWVINLSFKFNALNLMFSMHSPDGIYIEDNLLN